MANKKVTDLDALIVASENDIHHVIDVSDTSHSPEGTSKKITLGDIKSSLFTDDADLLDRANHTGTQPSSTISDFASIIRDLSYVHDQGVPNSVWTINHNLNKYPSAIAVDTAKAVMMGQIDYINLNNLTITFNASFSGEAYIN